MKTKWLLSAALSAMASTLAPAQALAQTAPERPGTSADVGEIIVTAQKREQKLSDVGMAITAVTGEQLAKRGVTDVVGLTKIEPSLQFARSGYGTPVYTLRGVGYFDQSLSATSAVAIYQDEVAYTYPVMTKGALLDLERVEVLRGPQGTLYGQNATGGAVNFIAARPTSIFAAGFDANYGRFNDVDLSGFVSGPLSPTLNARLALRLQEGGAWQKSNTRQDTLGDKDNKFGRLLLDWRPTDNFTATLNINGWTDNTE